MNPGVRIFPVHSITSAPSGTRMSEDRPRDWIPRPATISVPSGISFSGVMILPCVNARMVLVFLSISERVSPFIHSIFSLPFQIPQ